MAMSKEWVALRARLETERGKQAVGDLSANMTKKMYLERWSCNSISSAAQWGIEEATQWILKIMAEIEATDGNSDA